MKITTKNWSVIEVPVNSRQTYRMFNLSSTLLSWITSIYEYVGIDTYTASQLASQLPLFAAGVDATLHNNKLILKTSYGQLEASPAVFNTVILSVIQKSPVSIVRQCAASKEDLHLRLLEFLTAQSPDAAQPTAPVENQTAPAAPVKPGTRRIIIKRSE